MSSSQSLVASPMRSFNPFDLHLTIFHWGAHSSYQKKCATCYTLEQNKPRLVICLFV